jgi:hypothetical protein
MKYNSTNNILNYFTHTMNKFLALLFLVIFVNTAFPQFNKFDISFNPGISFILAQKEWTIETIPNVQTGGTYKELNESSYFDITGDFAYNFNKMFSAGVSIGFMNLIEYKLYSFQALGRIKFYDKKFIPFAELKFGANIVGVDEGTAPNGNICLTVGAGTIFEVTKNFGFKAGINYKYINPDLMPATNVQVGNEQGNTREPINASMINLSIGINISL